MFLNTALESPTSKPSVPDGVPLALNESDCSF